jgi:beta-glucosidase
MLRKTSFWRGMSFVMTIMLAITSSASVVLESFNSQIDSLLGTSSEKIVTSDDGSLWSTFTPPTDVLNADGSGNSEKLIKKFIDFGREQAAGGSVLLKNGGAGSDKVLPLSSGSKVTLLGARSHTMIQGASFGMPIEGPVITFEEALSKNKTDFTNPANIVTGGRGALPDVSRLSNYDFDGAGYKLNPTMIGIYDTLNKENKLTLVGPRQSATFDPLEPSIAQMQGLDANYKASFASYNDAAIVVVGRPSGESNDYLPGGVAAGTGAKEPLELTTNERDLIKLATDNFNKVIVLINTTSTMEIDELKENSKVDAILWVAHPGNYGTLGIADILCGKVNPSGALTDLYAAKNMSHPAMQNMGKFSYSNKDLITRGISSQNYVMEPEGIYVGYRYYETRYNDIVYGTGNANSTVGAVASKGNWNYNDEVTYGFGYGLSYSTFTQEFVGNPVINVSAHSITMDFKVKVTNSTSGVKGKSIVQIYGQAPYIKGGVEKSAIQLLGFDKTGELAPGASETLTIKVDLQDLASYDSSVTNGDGTKGTYILDEGKYYFSFGNGAHDALNNILTKQGKSAGMDYAGSAAKVFEWNYDYKGSGTVDTTTFAISKNNQQVSNQLEYADWNSFEGASKVTNFSRSDWQGTYPKTYANMTAPASMIPLLNGKYYEVKTTDDTSAIKFGDSSVEYTLADMKLSDYDDPRWDALMNKISLVDAMGVIAANGNNFRNLDSIGFPKGSYTENSGNGVALSLFQTITPNAPWTIATPTDKSDPNSEYKLEVFGAGPLVASSFDPDLFKELGETIGLQALFVGLPILWGPGLNTHRHPYNGRNGDYYSEDPILSGVVAMEFSMGALKYGLIAAPKHFAFNDQETNRGNVAPFMTEQRAREIELRAFQIAVEANKYDTPEKNVGMLGLMSSFSKIGPVECTSSYGLQTGILQNEWGFHGYAVTDINDDFDIFTAVAYSGSTGYDVRMGYTDSGFDKYQSMADKIMPTPEMYAKDATMLKVFKTAAHRTLWTFAQSNFMNAYNSSSHVEWQMTWWRGAYIGGISVFGILMLGFATMYILSTKKAKKDGIAL